MLSAMDEEVGQMVKALKDTQMFDDTIILFLSDVRLKVHSTAGLI